MEFTAENVEKACSIFYQNIANSSSSELANTWLISAQSSSQAWIFSWQLLDRSKPVEVQFFGASSLQTKISRYWNEVPPDQYMMLRDRLTSTLLTYSCGPRIVLSRLCLALSSVILHSVPEHWTNPLSDLLSMLQQLNGPGALQPQFTSLLLEILTVLPEEFQTLRLSHERRVAVRKELLSAAKDVMPILREVISASARPDSVVVSDEVESAAESGIRCLSSWIQHGVGIGMEESVHLVEPLLAAAGREALAEAALDAITHLVNLPEAPRFPNILMAILGQLLQLQDLLQSLKLEGNWMRAAPIYGVFAAFGESHSRLLLDAVVEGGTKREHVLQLVQILLQSTGTPGRYHLDENCSHLAFSFWYILQDDICSSGPEHHKLYNELFGPVYLTLVDILMTKSMIIDEPELSAEDEETFRCYRQDIADTLAYCYNFLRSLMMERLVSHLAQCNSNQDAWPQLEACLYALKAVAENVDVKDEQLVPQILRLFGGIQFCRHRHVVNTALETLGAYAEWLSAHPTYLGHVLPILLFGLSSREAAPAATMALKDITRDCQLGLRPYAESLLQACEHAILVGQLNPNEKVRLMFILGKVLSTLPLEAIVASLNRVVGPCVEDLRSLCAAPEADATTKGQLMTRLKMIATLCTTLDVRATGGSESDDDSAHSRQSRHSPATSQQPVLLIAQQLLPYLKGVIDRWGADEQITESICLVVKHTVSTLMDETVAFLPDMASVIVQCHRLSPQTATLDVAKLILLMFSQSTGETHELLGAFLSEIIRTTLQVCGVGPSASTDGVPAVDAALLSENTDVLAAFLTLLAQLLRKSPHFLSDSASVSAPLATLFYCGIAGLSRPESPTLKAATQYLVQFIVQSREQPQLVTAVESHGQLLVNQLLKCIGGESPRVLVEHMADVFLALNKKYFDNLCRWLTYALSRDNFPSALVSDEQKKSFCRMVIKERSNKRRLQDITRDFSLHCRGLTGTEYSRQMANHILP